MPYLFPLALCIVGALNTGFACQAYYVGKPLSVGVCSFNAGACGVMLLFYLIGVMLIEPLQEAD